VSDQDSTHALLNLSLRVLPLHQQILMNLSTVITANKKSNLKSLFSTYIELLCATNLSFLWLYSPIFGLGHLHETFCFISVTRSRTVGSTPWTGDQLVARHMLTGPGDCDDGGEVGGMNGFGRGNRSTRRKPAPMPLYPQIPLARPGREPGPSCGKPATNCFSYGADQLYL
jgi:hypothetical protein